MGNLIKQPQAGSDSFDHAITAMRRRNFDDGSKRLNIEAPPNHAPSSQGGVAARIANLRPAAKDKRAVESSKTLDVAPPPGFFRKKDGWWYSSGSDGASACFVCGPLDFVALTRDENGGSWGIHTRWRDPDDTLHNNSIPMLKLASDGTEIRATMLDRGCPVSTTAYGKGKFMELLGTIDIKARAMAVGKTGWFGSAFVTPNGTIGDTPDNRVIYQVSDISDHAYRQKGDLTAWKDEVASLAVGNSRLVLGLSVAVTGPLLGLLGEEGGGVHVRGPSSIGKSTMLYASASVWGGPDFLSSWSATANGLEGKCVQHNETVLILDEISQLDPKDAAVAAYLIANGSGKARASRSGSLRKAAKWQVPFLSSGEISLAELAARDGRGAKRSAAGQEVRILDVEADAGAGLGLFEALHDAPCPEALARGIKDGAAKVYGVAGPAFVERIAANRDEITATLKKAIDDFVAAQVPVNANGQVARAGRRFGLIAAAGELAIELGIFPWPAGEASAACATIFHQWMKGRGGVGSAEDREAIAKVRGFLEMHGGSRFEPVDADDDTPRIHNRAGFWRNTKNTREYLFLSETWKNEVCAGLDARRVAKVLADRGLLVRDSGGKNSISVNLPAGIGKTRCYVVSAAIFDEGGDS